MSAFKFGPLSIDPVALGSAGNAILGIRDSGKTYTASLLAERLFESGVPFVAFDPIGVWRFLRVPGKGRGYPTVVAGGQHGDLPLSPHSAPAIVEAAMQNGVSIVIDLFSLELSKADWKRIVRDCVRLMLHRNQQHGLRHVFIEEASEFVPQRVIDGDVYAEIEKLARMGGNARLGYTLINQRAEEVNKAVLELCDNLFLHRQKGRNSLTALSKWLDIGAVKDHKQIIDTLSTLPTGECWAWLAGTERPVHVKVPAKNSLHPDRRVMRGDTEIAAKAAVDVGTFVETMRSTLTVVEEEAKANDPKLLRAEIARLKRALEQNTLAGHSDADIEQARAQGFEDGKAEGLRLRGESVQWLLDAIGDARATMHEQFGAVAQMVETWRDKSAAMSTSAATIAAPKRDMPPAVKHSDQFAKLRNSATQGDSTVGNGGLRRMLIALAQRPQGMSARALGVRAGLSSSSGTFSTYLAKGRSAGWIDGDRSGMRITADGIKALGPYQPLPTGSELLAHWLGELGDSGAARLLRELARVYPRSLSKEDAAARAELSPTSGTFATYTAKLRTLELISGRGELKASEELFD